MGDGLKRAFQAARATRVQPLEWHRECLANHARHVEGLRRDMARKTAELERSERDLAFHAEQIATAERLGRTEFDRERFLISKRK